MKTNPNDPINLEPMNSEGIYHYNSAMPGLTIRQYYAGLAMQGLCGHFATKGADIARIAVQQADALIDQLNKEEK